MSFLILLLVGGALLGGVSLWVSSVENNPRLQSWKDAATACGLQIQEGSSWAPVVARAGAVAVRFEPGGDKGQSTRILIEAPGRPDFRSVRIRPQSGVVWGREIEVGDVSFDSAFFIEGPALLVFAWLDAETRRLLFLASTASRLEISKGVLQAEVPDEKVPFVLPPLFEVGQRLARPMDVPQRLAENAKEDPAPGVRLRNLRLLIRELPEDRWTLEALRAASTDSSPEIRLRAARELGAEGHGVLFELAEGLVDDPVSAEAVSILGQELPFERTRAILDRALNRRRLRTARACLEALGESGDAAAVGVLEQVVDREGGELAAVAALALGATGSPAAEPSLIQALGREQEDLRVAAAKALGRVGSAAAVLPLKEAAERSWLDLELRWATRQAIAEIQSRLEGASPGQLSLAGAGAEAGQLSLAADASGQLSLSDAEEERS